MSSIRKHLPLPLHSYTLYHILTTSIVPYPFRPPLLLFFSSLPSLLIHSFIPCPFPLSLLFSFPPFPPVCPILLAYAHCSRTHCEKSYSAPSLDPNPSGEGDTSGHTSSAPSTPRFSTILVPLLPNWNPGYTPLCEQALWAMNISAIFSW